MEEKIGNKIDTLPGKDNLKQDLILAVRLIADVRYNHKKKMDYLSVRYARNQLLFHRKKALYSTVKVQ